MKTVERDPLYLMQKQPKATVYDYVKDFRELMLLFLGSFIILW